MKDKLQEFLKSSTWEVLGVPEVDHRQLFELIIRDCAEYIDNHLQIDQQGHVTSTCTGRDLLKHYGINQGE
jgi:hypothetical protein